MLSVWHGVDKPDGVIRYMRMDVEQARDSVLNVTFEVSASREERVDGNIYQKDEMGQKWN